jgi:hypothetical protein
MKKLIAKFSAMKIAFWMTFAFSRMLNWLINLTGKYSLAISPAKSETEAVRRLSALTWSPDIVEIGGEEIKHGWMHTAKWVQVKLDAKEELQTDCDEFALYALDLLEGIYHISRPRLLTLRWTDERGKVAGHNTCLFSYPDSKTGSLKFGTLCNWGLKKGYRNAREAAMYFVSEKKGDLIAFTVSTSGLKILKHVKA